MRYSLAVATFAASCCSKKSKAHASVYGARWQRNGALISSELRERIVDRPVWGDDLQQLLARTKIVLNITRTDFFGARPESICVCLRRWPPDAFLLTDYCEEIEDLFRIGREIEVFRSSGELVDKVRHYLDNDDQRLDIARRGHEVPEEPHLGKSSWTVVSHMNL